MIRSFIAASAIVFVSLTPVLAQQVTPPAVQAPVAQTPAKPFVYAPKTTDITFGQMGAPVTVVEYGSLSCPHCAHFYSEVFPAVTTKYIDTGKVLYVYRNYLRNEPDLKGSQLIQCADKDRRPLFLKVLFSTQAKWAYDANFKESLANIAVLGGMARPQFDACMQDKTIEKMVLQVGKEGQDDYKINSTPTFFVNGTTPEGANSLEGMSKAVDAALATSAKK